MPHFSDAKKAAEEMQLQHTLGPWEAYKKSNGGWSVKSIHAAINDSDVTDTYRDEIYLSEADARLIAAAPELLAILSHVVTQLENDVREAEIACDSLECERATERLEKARTVVAKATGDAS